MPQNKFLYGLGWALIGFCLVSLLALLFLEGSQQVYDPFGAFVFVYLCTFVYFVIIFFQHTSKNGWKEFYKGDEHTYSLALVLFSLSAHTLNLSDIRIFSNYTSWLWIYVVLLHVTVLAFPFRKVLPDWGQYIIYGISGASAVLCLYLTIFIGPLNLWAIPLALLLGISMMATVPAWMLLYFIQAYSRMEKLPFARRAYWTGALVPILVLTFFLQRWDTIQRSIEDAEQSYQLQTDPDLPKWVRIASELPEGRLTAEVMLASGVTQRSFWRSGGFGGLNSVTDEFEIHNPLALIAMTLYGELELEDDEVVNILEANYDARHMTHRRLWSGHNLSTSEVHTKVDLYPQFRLAYEEMAIHIHHDGKTNRWRDEQEAVYSFHLPEGAVATSLSLWIEGEEQFSRLTTKSKADSAYTQIVGVEVRDPALLHWQEGNRVSVTVFPCTPEEDRIFKIGFTTPLTDEGERLMLRHVSFDGPATWKATATTEIHIHSDQELAYVQKPTIWHNEEEGYSYKGSYQSDWTLSFKETALSDAFFQFNGFQYQLAEARQNLQSWTAEEVILDINSSWDPITYRMILDKVGEKPVYVFLPEKTRITEDNADEVFLQLRKQAFALLPLYTFSNSESSLVITKSRGMSPLLVDVENTFYHNRMYEYFSSKPPAIKMICLGEEIPPYLKTLVDLGCVSMVFNRDFSWDKCLSESVYPQEELADEEVLIRGANVKIKKQPIEQESSSTATDHLARLHTYGSLMNSMGGDYFIKDKIEDTWVRKAEEGYIVSPVSSLVVLESEEDYDRFGIEENRDTLGNAAKKGDGSAPEPHEWALIILFGAILLFGAWKKWGWAIKLGV